MAIVLQSTGGGSVSIQEPTTASNFTQTLPASTGTVAVADSGGRLQAGTANNVGLGYQALNSNTASNNTAVGYQAGYSNTVGTNCTYLGYQTGYYTTSSDNTFLGYGAGNTITTGAKNTIIGKYTGNAGGLDIRTASNYIVLSDGDGNPRVINDGTSTSFGTTASILRTQSGGTGGVVLNAQALGIADFARNASQVITVNLLGVTGDFINFRYNGTGIGSIATNGTSNVQYLTSSDYRLKDNIVPMTGALAKVTALKPVTYKWKSTGEDGEGFIAHELQEVCPDAVAGEKDAVDEDGNIAPQAIDTSFLVATLTAAIQELSAQVDAQALEIATLKG